MINYVICNAHLPPVLLFLHPSLSHIHLFSFLLNKSSSQISPSALHASPALAQAAGSLPTAEDVHAQRRCVIPPGWGANETGGLLMVVRV